ncbi:Crp/Fnr family transcriptional regulator [Paenibacillus sp. KQZ6P-2]|uniref:Crp/Fnr family transcriptional regulator n=1 Tax=Paenibacillus mangrovi TaxID=2931978 RepID=A0A9X1WRE7_9BACL|nr:Crp/Fnr family transcriptional regulator [Paenibacillus mangrovi]MCJ8012035.1 Crp/Fnr family transcriptional regulator [Paenibacillus mangrovi]
MAFKPTDKRLLNVFPCLSVVQPAEWAEAHPFVQRFPAKSSIFRREDAAVYGMFLLSGTARITVINEQGSELVLNMLAAGEVCSLMVLSGLSGRDYPGSLIAETDVDVLFVLKSSFLRWVQEYEPIRTAIFGGLLEGMLRMVDMLQEKQYMPLEKRLAKALLRATEEGKPLLHTTHQELADEIGTAREVVSRSLQRFKQNGWIETGRGWVRIDQRSRLEDQLGD